jgi:hypothetical protein
MMSNILKRRGLFLASLGITSLFAILLLGIQYLAFHKLSTDREMTKGRSKVSTDEITLYQANTRNMVDLFLKEIEAVENESSSLNARIERNYISSKIRPVQAYFNEYARKRPDYKSIFLLNKQGRLLAFTPFNEDDHNEIYDEMPYYKHLRMIFVSTKKNAATYFYALDPEIVNRGVTNIRLIQNPFFRMGQAALVPRGELNKSLLSFDETAPGEQIDRLPYVITASPFFYDDGYWGMSGFVIPFSHFVNRIKDNMPSRLLRLFIFTHDGRILFAPDGSMVGLTAKSDELFQKIIQTSKKSGDSGFFFHNAGPVFYAMTEKFIFLTLPVKYMTGIRDASIFRKPLPTYVILMFVIELMLIALLFLMYHKKIVLRLQSLLKTYGEGILPLDSQDEIMGIEQILASLSASVKDGVGEVLPAPDLLTPVDHFARKITNKTLFGKAGEECLGLMDSPASDMGTAVYLSLHNAGAALEDSRAGLDLINSLAPIVYRLAELNDGFIASSTSTSFIVCFGIPFKDANHLQKAWNFISALLKEVKSDPSKPLAVGCAAETGKLIYGGMKYEGQEEFVVSGPAMDLIQKVESVAGDNVAILGQAFIKQGVVPKGYVKEEIVLKVRDQKDNVAMYVVKVD